MPIELSFVLKRDTYFPKHKITKLLYVFFLFYHAVGFDFGFASAIKRKYRLIIQRTTRFLSIFSILVMLSYLAFFYDDVWCWFNTVKYNGFILVLIAAKYKLYHLIYDINNICALTTKQMNILNIITILFTVLMYLIKITVVIVRCYHDKEPYCGKFYSMFYYYIYLGIELSLDLIAVTRIVITYYLKCSLNQIKILLKKPNRRLDVYEKSYIAIADCYDKIRPLYDWLVSLLLIIYRIIEC